MRISTLIFGIIPLVTGSSFTYYKKYEENDDKRCSAEDEIITNKKTSNEAKCIGLCSSSPACRSVFVNTDLNLCYGCSKMYPKPTGLLSSPGTKHFWKPSTYTTYMGPCTGDSECLHGANQGCNNNTCTCKPGYPFDRTSTSCVTSCPVYGSSFEVYGIKLLNVISFDTMSFQPLAFDCMTHCASLAWCRAFDHSIVTMKCFFKSLTAATNPADFKTNLMHYDHYSRNCQ